MPTEAELRERIAQLEHEVETLKRTNSASHQGVRRRSSRTLLGLPLYDVALGPDPEAGEIRGHAKGFIAVGDIATGVFACGGVAFGLIAAGGLAIGGVCLGGAAIGLLFGLGGLATGALAFGGSANGFVAIGGGAVGYYDAGGGAIGQHVLSAAQQDPEALRFFNAVADYLPLVRDILDKLKR